MEAIPDPLERRYALLHEAEALGLPFDSLASMLADYALSRRTQRGRIERGLYRLAGWFEDHSLFDVLEYVGRLAILVAIGSFLAGLPEIRERQQAQRWQAVKEAAGDEYDSNRLESLEALSRGCFPMAGLEAPRAQLAGIRLDGCHRLLGRFGWGGGWLGPRLPGLYRYQGANLRGAGLEEADLAGAGLAGADLVHAVLRRTRLAGADLRGADLRHADLTGADLLGADLAGATLVGADLTGADLSRADLSGAVLDLAGVCGTRFVRSRLRHAQLDHVAGCPPAAADSTAAAAPNFSGADLRGAQLYEADLRGGRFTRVRLDGRTSFDEADLGDARFDHVELPASDPFSSARVPPPDEARPPAPPGATRHPRPLRLGFIAADDLFFFAEVSRGVHRAAEAAGVPVEVVENPVTAAEVDARSLVAARGEQVDALVLRMRGLSYADVVPAHDAGVALVCYDQCPESESAAAFLTASFESSGFDLGYDSGLALRRWLSGRARSLPASLPVLVLRSCRGESCFRRVRGFREALAGAKPGNAGVRLRETGYVVSGSDPFPDACDLLRRNPGPVVLWTANERGTEAAVEAVHALGRQGEAWVFGIDLNPVLAARLLDPRNVLQAVVAQDPEGMGFAAASRALAAARGELHPYERVLTGRSTWSRGHLDRRQARLARRLAAAGGELGPRPCPPA